MDADGRISRIRLMASGARVMRNGLETLMTDFSETQMRKILGWNYRRKLKRVYVWPISRSQFRQDKDRERLLSSVQQYYKLDSFEEAEKRIIPRLGYRLHLSRARDPDAGLQQHSGVGTVQGRFRADQASPAPPPCGGAALARQGVKA